MLYPALKAFAIISRSSSLSVTLLAYSFAFASRSVITGCNSTSIGSSSQVRSGKNEFSIEVRNFPENHAF